MYRTVLDIIQEIREAKGHDKHPLIVKHLNEHQLFAKVVQYTLDTSKTFKIRKVKWTVDSDPGSDLFSCLDYLDSKRGATKIDRAELSACASTSDPKFQVVNIILSRKLRCGCTAKTLKDLVPGFVPYFPYMRCSGLDQLKKIVFPCYSQLKADGEYFDVFLNRSLGVPKFQTRNGKMADFSQLGQLWPQGPAKLSGEALLLKEDGSGYEDRKDGNAIINKALYGLLSQEEAERIRFSFWDVMFGKHDDPLYYNQHYKCRWDDLQQMGLHIIECRVVNNMEEAWAHYDVVRARGLEGTILKNFDGYWADGTSMNQVKLKAEKECELEVYDVVPGSGKYRGMVGSLCCRSSCGKLLTDVGMGLSDEDRAQDDWVGQVITVKFNTISKSKVKETWAMSHARLMDTRPDKNAADDLEYIKKVKEVKRK